MGLFLYFLLFVIICFRKFFSFFSPLLMFIETELRQFFIGEDNLKGIFV